MMETGKRRKPVHFPARLMLNLSPETLARIEREAEATQQTLAGVARAIIVRNFAKEGERPTERVARPDDEARAA
jgi:hypothetical protein